MPVGLSTFLGTEVPSPLHGGHQALVFEAVDESGQRCVAKLRGMGDADPTILNERMLAVASLARIDSRVCSPLMTDGGYVTEVIVDGEPMLGTLLEHAQGENLNHAEPADAQAMGVELARLHDSLDALPGFDLPLVPALAATRYEAQAETLQLLHGDFSAQNLRRHAGTVSIFDFDDCGYGPREFDVANSLYMVLFDHMTTQGVDVFEQFEAEFLDGYHATSPRAQFEADTVSYFIDLRVRALRVWLDEPESAPAFIRAASPEWHRTLRHFTESYWERTR